MPPDSIICQRCGQYNIEAIRCRVDKLDLKDYYRVFREGALFSSHPKR